MRRRLAAHLVLQILSFNARCRACNPAGAAPYTDVLVTYGPGTTSNYGLGFDPVGNELYAWENSTKQIVVIQ